MPLHRAGKTFTASRSSNRDLTRDFGDDHQMVEHLVAAFVQRRAVGPSQDVCIVSNAGTLVAIASGRCSVAGDFRGEIYRAMSFASPAHYSISSMSFYIRSNWVDLANH